MLLNNLRSLRQLLLRRRWWGWWRRWWWWWRRWWWWWLWFRRRQRKIWSVKFMSIYNMSSHIVVFSGKLDITLWALIHLYGSKAGCKIKRFRSNLSFIHLFIHSLYICLLCRISSFHDGTSTWKDVPKVCLSTMWSVLLKKQPSWTT